LCRAELVEAFVFLNGFTTARNFIESRRCPTGGPFDWAQGDIFFPTIFAVVNPL